MEMHFVKGKEGNFVLEREKEKEGIGQNLKIKKKVLEVLWERNPEKKKVCTWSGLARIKIKFN